MTTTALTERKLNLLIAIDAVRDHIDDDGDPKHMLDQLLRVTLEHLQANAGALVMFMETSDDIESTATNGITVATANTLAQQIAKWTESAPQPIALDGWAQGIGMRIILDGYLLGALVLLRRMETPFEDADLALLRLAESQMDSAIVQARRIWKLAQRNRELDAIYELDQLRDDNSDEGDLVTGFTKAVLEQFHADLCVVMLSHIDSGALVVRGIVDKVPLKAGQIDAIANQVRQINITQVIPTPEDVNGLYLLASPFIVAGMRLGALIIGRKRDFTLGDHRLLYAMSSQMDSAIVYSRVIEQLSQRNKELEIIYNVDQIRDSDLDFDELLQRVLGEMCSAVNSELGYILLYDNEKEDQLEIKSTTREGMMTSAEYYESIHAMSRRALEKAEMVFENERAGKVRSIIAVPLVLHNKVIGVFGAVNSTHSSGFNAEDQRMLTAITSQVDTAVFERLEQRRVRQVMGRSVDPKVLAHLLSNANPADILSGERMEVSVVFADLRGSTEWAERTEPEELVMSLNAYLGRMSDVIFKHGGTLDKFVGDEVIGLFGTPLPMDDHSKRAARAALEMQQEHARLQEEMLRDHGFEIPPMGVGVSTGEAICGEFGTKTRTDFTAMGRMMNLGARLCSAASECEVVISEATYTSLKGLATAQPMQRVSLKGIGDVMAYKLEALDGE